MAGRPGCVKAPAVASTPLGQHAKIDTAGARSLIAFWPKGRGDKLDFGEALRKKIVLLFKIPVTWEYGLETGDKPGIKQNKEEMCVGVGVGAGGSV